MNRRRVSLVLICAFCLCAPAAGIASTIPAVAVGDVGNANNSSSGTLCSGVNDAYYIHVDAVSNARYADFLFGAAASNLPVHYVTNKSSDGSAARIICFRRGMDDPAAIS